LIVIILAGTLLLYYFVYKSSNKYTRELRTDINMDGITDQKDYNLFLKKFDQSCSGCAEDINNDGHVDGHDMLILLGEFNKSKKGR
jgi:hypothetical protein